MRASEGLTIAGLVLVAGAAGLMAATIAPVIRKPPRVRREGSGIIISGPLTEAEDRRLRAALDRGEMLSVEMVRAALYGPCRCQPWKR